MAEGIKAVVNTAIATMLPRLARRTVRSPMRQVSGPGGHHLSRLDGLVHYGLADGHLAQPLERAFTAEQLERLGHRR